MVLFFLTGLGLIIYNNQPPNEPRERDYVLVGSFITFAMWVGMAVLAFFKTFKDKLNMPSKSAALLGIALGITAPLIMGIQNFDDHTRRYEKDCKEIFGGFLHHYPYYGLLDAENEKNWKDNQVTSNSIWNELFDEELYESSYAPNCPQACPCNKDENNNGIDYNYRQVA